MLTITNFDDPEWQKKRIVYIQGRLHPGETASSWIIHGLISFLISRSRVSSELRKRLIFKIVPMCNPDGVIIGNTRTTLMGRDMNR
jgi:murein tripeptide amidase MpaA